jgi:hypothetical protein
MSLSKKLKEIVYHGAPSPSYPTQQHQLIEFLEELAARVDELVEAVEDEEEVS